MEDIMTARHYPPAVALMMIAIAVLACSIPGVSGPSASSPEQMTLEAVGTRSAQETAAAGGEMEATEAPAGTAVPEETGPTSEPTTVPTIEHTTFPGNPGSISSFMTDRSTLALASEGRAVADSFDQLLFERPFSAQVMDYKGYLDITRGELSASSPWFYAIIYLEESPPAESEPFYGVEIDLDKNGRGDVLIWGLVAPDTEWTTDGVQVLKDSNNDVGGGIPVVAESPPQTGNGYDDLVFDAGIGPDPDAAWIRRSPSSPTQIQLAFKQSLIGSSSEFLWGVWADEGPQNAAFFDYNDHWSISEAGSPASNSSNYPLKELAMVDNSCRWGYGFTPTGTEPGACFIPPTPTPTFTPTATPLPATLNVIAYRDYNNNGSRNSGDGGLSGVSITVRSGSCSGSVVDSTTTGSSGSASFPGLAAGTYCVTVDYPTVCFDNPWLNPAVNSRTVTLAAGGVLGISFPFAPYVC
jgi:hypothetical protein